MADSVKKYSFMAQVLIWMWLPRRNIHQADLRHQTRPARRDHSPVTALRSDQFIHCQPFVDHMRIGFAARPEPDGRHAGRARAVCRVGAETIRAELRIEAGGAQTSQGSLDEGISLRQEPRRQELRPAENGAGVGLCSPWAIAARSRSLPGPANR